MQTLMFIGAAFAMGMIMSIYLPMNSSVSRYLGSSIAANVTFFMVAFLTSLLILFFSGETNAVYRFRQVPVYLYLTGFISAFIVLGTTFLIPCLGARKFFILLIAGQVGMAIVVSHFGILESQPDPVSARKLAGAVLVIAGAMISVS